jgi:hypothetical protein
MSFDPKSATIGEMEAWRAAQRQAAKLCDGVAMSSDGDNTTERTIRATARNIRTGVLAMQPEAQP